MRLNANGDIGRPGEPDAYWRRRFFMLGGGLFVLMLIAWLFSSGPSPSDSRTAASKADADHHLEPRDNAVSRMRRVAQP